MIIFLFPMKYDSMSTEKIIDVESNLFIYGFTLHLKYVYVYLHIILLCSSLE